MFELDTITRIVAALTRTPETVAGAIVITLSFVLSVAAFFVATSVRHRYSRAEQRLKAIHEAPSHMRRAQFEVEFQTYQAIWEAVVSTHRIVIQFRPIFEVASAATPPERKAERLTAFVPLFNAYATAVDAGAPFYPANIHSLLTQLREAFAAEAYDYEYVGTHPEAYERSKANVARIKELMEQSSAAIRARLAAITVID